VSFVWAAGVQFVTVMEFTLFEIASMLRIRDDLSSS